MSRLHQQGRTSWGNPEKLDTQSEQTSVDQVYFCEQGLECQNGMSKLGLRLVFSPLPDDSNPVSVPHDCGYKHELECWQIFGAEWKFHFSDGKI